MSAEASMQCGAAHGERSEERVNSRNGYRQRRWDTRVGTIEELTKEEAQARWSSRG
jgi:putative transposase